MIAAFGFIALIAVYPALCGLINVLERREKAQENARKIRRFERERVLDEICAHPDLKRWINFEEEE